MTYLFILLVCPESLSREELLTKSRFSWNFSSETWIFNKFRQHLLKVRPENRNTIRYICTYVVCYTVCVTHKTYTYCVCYCIKFTNITLCYTCIYNHHLIKKSYWQFEIQLTYFIELKNTYRNITYQLALARQTVQFQYSFKKKA